MADSSFPKVFVVILNFNGNDTLPLCLNSVFQSDYPNFEIVLVDNNSSDGSFEQAKRTYSRSHFIKNSENVGFSKGNNVGIRFALEKFADHIFVLNNDTVLEKNTLSLLVNTTIANPEVGAVSPLILKADNKNIWFAGGAIKWNEMKAVHISKNILLEPYQSEYLSGCAMLIKKEVFKKIGLFDERFFLYYEDTDFSLRTTKAGFKLLIDPSAHIQHLEQSSLSNAKFYWLVLSGLIFFQTHTPKAWRPYLFAYLILRKTKNFYKTHFTKDSIASEIRKAYVDFKKLPR